VWVRHPERPLRAGELCHALAVQLSTTDFHIYQVSLISTLVGSHQGLIAVDKETSTVRLIHITLQEYLSSGFHIFSKPRSGMAESCLTYLNSRQVDALLTAPFPDTQNAPFLEYGSIHWRVHAKGSSQTTDHHLRLELL